MHFKRNNLVYSSFFITILFIVKFLLIKHTPFTVDEISSKQVIFSGSNLEGILNYIKLHDTQMPLFYIWSYFFKPLGLERSPICILVGLAGFLPFFLKLRDRKWIVFSVFLSVSYFSFRHSVNFRPYGMVFFESILFVCGLELYKINGEKKGLWLASIALLLLLFTHYYGMLVCLCFYINELFLKKSYFNKKWLILFTFICMLMILPFVKDLWIDFNTVHFYRKSPSLIELLKAVVLQFNGGLGTVFVFTLILFNRVVFFRTCDKYKEYLVYIILSFLIAYLKSVVSAPAFSGAYFIFLSPFVMIILSDFLLQLKYSQWWINAFIVISLFFNYRDFIQRAFL